MRIEYTNSETKYYDMNGVEIREGDIVLMGGRKREVYRTEEDCLGTDATNPLWVARGLAAPCEYGVYPFCAGDEPVIIKANR